MKSTRPPSPVPTNAPISDPKTLEQTPSEAAAVSTERMEAEANIKAYWDEQRRTARERLLTFAELGEARRKHGYHPALPPLEMFNFPDLLGRAWGWDSLMPCSSEHYWSKYKKYLHDYYVHNSSKANVDHDLNGDDENDLAALADSCIAMENELESMMMRRPKTFNDYEISLSNKITKRARELRDMKCSEFPAAAVALKCITKEADLMCQSLVCGRRTSALISCRWIRAHALSFVTYKGPEHVAAAATMMGATKEAISIRELLKNEGDDKKGEFFWSTTIRDGALHAMIKIFNECFSEDSTMGSIAEKLVFGESDDKNCSKNELVQNDNAKETDNINQETKVENSQKVERAQNVDPIDAAHSLLQQISLQQKQSTKSLKVLVETLSNVKGSVKGSKGVIDQILGTVQRLESDYQLVINQVVDAKNQLEELSTGIGNFQVRVFETEMERREVVKDLKNELGVGLRKLASEVSESLIAIQQVKQSNMHLETMVLLRNKQLEESLSTKQKKLEGWVQLMLTQLEERVLLKQRTSEDATKLLLNQLYDRMLSLEKSLHSTILLKHTHLVEINAENNRHINQRFDQLHGLCDEMVKLLSK